MPKRGRNNAEGPPIGEGGVNMASPMQDTVVSSTVTSVHSPSYNIIENNFQCDTIQELARAKYKKARIRKMSNCKSNSTDNCEFWLSDYSKAINRIAGSRNYECFQRFLAVYAKNVAKDAFTWKSELSKLDTLRKHISNVLLHYHFNWFKWKEKATDNYFYLQKMSDILVTYVNLELRFFNENISECKISNILLNAVCIYLDYSEEHIFKVLLKSELVTKQNKNIFLPILEKCFFNVKMKKEDITEITYIRYILALKLWKSMNDDKEEDNKIKHLALTILGSETSLFNFNHYDFFPQAPKQCINKTMWYLQTKSFDLETTIESFLKYTENLNQSTISHELKMIEECENCYHIQIDENVSPTKNPRRNSLRRRRLKPGQILVIDLTTDEPEETIVGEAPEDEDHSNIKKKVRNKVKWLEHLTRNRNLLNSLKRTIKTTVNADSTDNMENKSEKVCINLPISDNEVTESYKIDSNSESCDNFRSNNISTPSDSNDVIQNSDTTKDKENQNSEISKNCVKCSNLFNNCICDILINPNLLSNVELTDLSEAKLLASDLHGEITQEAVPSLINFEPSSMELFSNEFSFSEKDVINPCLTKKYSPTRSDKPYNSLHCKDSLLTSCGNIKNQLFTEISEFGLYKIENKDSVISNEESLITSTDASLNSFTLRLNSDVTMSDFSKTPFAENLISDNNEGEHYMENILKADDIQIKNVEDITIQPELGEEIFEDLESSTEDKKQPGRKRASTTLKIKEPPTQKIKVPELLGLNDNNDDYVENTSYLKQENTFEDETPAVLSESVNNFSENLSSKFLTENIPLENQQPKETTKMSNFQNLADCIKSNEHNKIITLFDPESSILKQLTSKKVQPSSCHYFIRLLCEKGLLLHHYTGNKGDLEKQIGISQEKFTVLPENVSDPFSFQSNCHFSLATLLIFFTNSLASISKWLKGKCPRLFIIQETTVEIENMFIADYLNLIPKPSKDLQLDSNTKFEVIRAETHDRGCKLLIDKLGWTEEAKEYERMA